MLILVNCIIVLLCYAIISLQRTIHTVMHILIHTKKKSMSACLSELSIIT